MKHLVTFTKTDGYRIALFRENVSSYEEMPPQPGYAIIPAQDKYVQITTIYGRRIDVIQTYEEVDELLNPKTKSSVEIK